MSATCKRTIPGVLLLCLTLASQGSPQARPVWEQSFAGTYGVLVLRNAAGRTTVASYTGASIQVIAERADGALVPANSIVVDKTAPGVLSIRVADGAAATLLDVKVPAHMHVSVQGDAGTVLVQGSLGGLTVETAAGPILVQLPLSADADISLKTGGEIVTGMPLLPAPAGTNAGLRMGRGGPRVDLRSASGKIVLLPYPGGEPAQRAAQAIGADDADAGAAETSATTESTQRTSGSGASGIGSSRRGNGPARGNSGAAISVTSQMVLANVTVAAPPATPAGALTAQDFDIFDEGRPQAISYFAPVQEPLDLILLLDLSGSTESKFKLIKKAVENFIAAINPQDRVAIAGFTARFLLVSDFTSDRKVLLDRVKRMKHPQGGTKFYRAMWLSLDMMARVKGSRKAIVVMTDGVDNSLQGASALQSPRVADLLAALSRGGRERIQQRIEEATASETDFEALLERIAADGVSVYPVYLNTEYEMVVRQGTGDSTQYQEAREQLQAIADACGTPIFKAERIEDLTGAYERVAAELRNLYTVGFYPTDARQPGEWHALGVSVKREGFTARTRRGYYVD